MARARLVDGGRQGLKAGGVLRRAGDPGGVGVAPMSYLVQQRFTSDCAVCCLAMFRGVGKGEMAKKGTGRERGGSGRVKGGRANMARHLRWRKVWADPGN